MAKSLRPAEWGQSRDSRASAKKPQGLTSVHHRLATPPFRPGPGRCGHQGPEVCEGPEATGLRVWRCLAPAQFGALLSWVKTVMGATRDPPQAQCPEPRAAACSERPLSSGGHAPPGYLGLRGCRSPPARPGCRASHRPWVSPVPKLASEAAGDHPQPKWPQRVSRPAAR